MDRGMFDSAATGGNMLPFGLQVSAFYAVYQLRHIRHIQQTS